MDWIEVYDGADESAGLKAMFVTNLRVSRGTYDQRLKGSIGHWYECGNDLLLDNREGYLQSSTNSLLLKFHTGNHTLDAADYENCYLFKADCTKPDANLPTGYRAIVDIGKKNTSH